MRPIKRVLGDDLCQGAEQLAIDLTKPLAERGRQLTVLRRRIADILDPALAAAGLLQLTPGGAPAAFGDDHALF